jgi:DNA modification methylase
LDTTQTKEKGLQIRRVALGALHTDPANARLHGAENMAAIEGSLARFGQAEPLVVQKATGRVVGGNGRLSAMTKLGWNECDVVELDLTDLEAAALGIALNRSGELAEWDDSALTSLLAALREENALDGLGFDDKALDELLGDLDAECGVVDDQGPGPVPDEPVTQSGDLWVLGDHRLLCGDSTDEDSFARVLTGKRADLVWTDPPYGVSYTGKTDEALTIENDELVGDDLEALLAESLGHVVAACRAGAVWYVAAPAGPNFLPFAKVLTSLGVWRQTLVWAKDAFVLGRSDFHYRHEAIFYGWAPGAAHQPPPTRTQDTIWEVARPKASREHPTMKPLELVVRALETSCNRGDLVLDPFGGSGTTLLAAESTGRAAHLIELDSRYCDVVVRRWEQATGKTALLDGISFAEVKETRGG